MHASQSGARDRASTPTASVKMQRLTSSGVHDARIVAEECPVALVYDGTTAAVLMATPADLTDLAQGFSLTEGIIRDIGEIEQLGVVAGPDGIELRLWLRPDAGRRLKERRRQLVGPTGCGLCGIDSLREAGRIAQPVEHRMCLTSEQIGTAIAALAGSQVLNHRTHATHAAGFFEPDRGTMLVREDVGRHNALDKLAGALAMEGRSGCTGAVILTSRISVEMVQKRQRSAPESSSACQRQPRLQSERPKPVASRLSVSRGEASSRFSAIRRGCLRSRPRSGS